MVPQLSAVLAGRRSRLLRIPRRSGYREGPDYSGYRHLLLRRTESAPGAEASRGAAEVFAEPSSGDVPDRANSSSCYLTADSFSAAAGVRPEALSSVAIRAYPMRRMPQATTMNTTPRPITRAATP